MKSKHALVLFASTIFLVSACGTTTSLGSNVYISDTFNYEGGYAERQRVYTAAKEKCASLGLSMEPIQEGSVQDKTFRYGLKYRCFSLAERQKQAEIKAERDRQAELERQRQADLERQKQAAEWEKARPQREAEQRAAAAAEQSRMNKICPIYYIARQTCATAPNYNNCMSIRLGSGYSSWDDQTCYRR